MKNKEVQKFLISATIVLASLIVIDKIVGIVCSKAMDAMPDYSGAFAKDNYTITRITNVDILVIGSSRASHHYDVKLLADSINSYKQSAYTIYNAGLDGNFINHNACRLESILDRYQPKLIIFEVGQSELLAASSIQRSISQMAPYYSKVTPAQEYLDRVNLRTTVQMQSAMYRFNNKPLRIISSILSPSPANDGYEPLYGELTHFTPEEKSNDELSEYSVHSLHRVMEKCKALGVNLVCISSPRYQPVDNNAILANICSDAGVPYFEIYNEEIFNSNSHYFKDAAHLNDTGAKVFTSILFEHLKPIIDNI